MHYPQLALLYPLILTIVSSGFVLPGLVRAPSQRGGEGRAARALPTQLCCDPEKNLIIRLGFFIVIIFKFTVLVELHSSAS